MPGPTAGQEGGSAAGPVTVVFQSHAEAVFFLVAKEGMKLVSEPLSMPLTAPFHYGKGTLSGFSFRGLFPACIPFHCSQLFYVIWWLSLVASVGVWIQAFCLSALASCVQAIPSKCFLVPYSSCSPALFLWVPFIPHFQPKIKTRREVQQYYL